MVKSFGIVAASIALLAGTLVPTTAATATEGGWPLVRTAYDGVIYELVTNDDQTQTPVAITFDEWRNFYNFAAPSNSPTDYVKYPWSPTVYAVTFWPGGEDRWQWNAINYDQWRDAGFPGPRTAGWIKGSYYYKWATSSEIFVEGADGVNHKLSYGEWQASGFRSFDNRGNEGFQKLSWSPEVVRMTDLVGGRGQAMSFGEWQEEAFPAPQVVSRMTGDQFYKDFGSSTIYYAGPGVNRPITFSEWSAAGRPTPTAVSNVIPGNRGMLLVGKEVSPGTYRSQGNSGCYWARRSGTGFDGIIANSFGDGQTVVTIQPGDSYFETDRCADWRSTSISSGPMLTTIPGNGGTFIVGSDVSAGTYRSEGNRGCYWATLSSFSGEDNINDNFFGDGSQIVTINPSDVGFETVRCGNWERIG